MLEFLQPPWVRRMMKLPQVHPAQAHQISRLTQELTQAIQDGLVPDSPAHAEAVSLSEYLDDNREHPRRENLIPPPAGWSPDHACTLLADAMRAFENASLTDHRPRDASDVHRLAYQLALAIAQAGWRNDPGHLLDKLVQGRIQEIPPAPP